MSMLLKQSTTITLRLGPALDKTDGVTEETALSPTVEISKAGGAFAARNSATAITHDINGWYAVELNATDTNTLGILIAKFDDSATHLPVWHEFMVLPANAYDSLVGGTDTLQSDLTQIGGVAQSATDLKDFADVGYDPVTNKVEGVKTVDTTTTNTDMRGTDNAALASVCTELRLAELDAANLPARTDGIQTDLDNATDGLGALKALLDAIKAVTDLLPDAGALTTLITHLTDIKGATFSGATDSLEAIRNRGDAAWTTGAGGSDRLLMVDTTIATLSSQTSFTLTAGSADDNAYNNCTIVIEDSATATQKAVGLISGYVGATKTVTLKYDPAIFTMAATDKVYILAENALKATLANRQLGVDANGDLTKAALCANTTLVDTVTTNTDMRGTDNAALASVCTELRLAELDAANLPARTDGIQTDLDNATDGLGALKALLDAIKAVTDLLPDAGALTTLITHLTDIKGATFSGATDSLEAIRNRGDAAWTTGAGGSDRLLMVDTTIATLTSQTSFTLTAGSADDNAYNNCTIVIEDSATATQKAVGLISGYVGATKTVTLKYDPAIFTMAATDKVYILAENALKATLANRQLGVDANGDLTKAALCANTTLVDTVTTNTDMRGTDNAALASVCTELRLAELDAANLPARTDGIQTDLDNATDGLGALKALLDAIKAVTDLLPDAGALTTLITHLTDIKGTAFVKDMHSLKNILDDTNELQTDDVPGLIAALNNISTSDVLTQVNAALDTAIAELAQAKPTATPTIRTGIMLLYMSLRNKLDITATTKEIHNDAGVMIAKKALSDDGTTYSEAEMGAGV